MRSIPVAILCVLLPVGAAQAQIKNVEGAAAAGLCASAMEFVAGARSAAGIATPQELNRLEKTRDLLLALPQFQTGEVEAYAQAWSQRMAENMRDATTPARRNAVSNDIAGIARKCHQDMAAEVRALNDQGITLPRTATAASAATAAPAISTASVPADYYRRSVASVGESARRNPPGASVSELKISLLFRHRLYRRDARKRVTGILERPRKARHGLSGTRRRRHQPFRSGFPTSARFRRS